MSDPYALDIGWVRRSFDRAGASYDAAAVLQAQVRDVLLERLDLTALDPAVVLDAGAGTGLGSRALKRRYPKAHVLAVDFAPGMLRAARGRRTWLRPSTWVHPSTWLHPSAWLRPFSRLCADALRLPLKDGAVDLVLSSLMLPWSDPDAVFAEFRRVLAPRGLLTFTSLGPDTLWELRGAWAQVDGHTRVSRFVDMHDLGDALVRVGFAAPVLDVERYTLSYADVRRLAADLQAMGARNATQGRLRGLTSPRKFAAMEGAYEIHRRDGRLPATVEVVFGAAFAPVATPARRGGPPGVSLEDVRRQLPTRRR